MTTTLAGYQIADLLYDGTRTQVYRGATIDESKLVVLKKLRKEYPTFSELLQFRHQYVLNKNLDLPGIVKPIALEKNGNGYVLVMEDVGGESLSEYISDRPLGIEEFLKVAIAMAKILEDLYRNRIIHKDIKPANILINPESKEIYLIDFSISSLLPRETQEIQNPNILEGTLAYIAPEQTGRMNRGIDYRSDFYSLGVTFYELLTGELPFKSHDPMELVHCHIARMPVAPHLVKADIPEVLSKLVMKLMAKTAEDRYQSAKGILHDLSLCSQEWERWGKISNFELASRDLSDRFCLPEKLYGRETEVQALLDAFERVSEGTTELMLVAGFSGIGKTAVVNEVHKPIVGSRGYFIKGKFDQFQRNIPFSALVIAFRDLMEQLLGETDAKLQEWKDLILDAVGDNGGVIIEVIPELEQIIGSQPPVAELSGAAAQNRFNRLFEKFICVFTTKEHPLVLFLDDLQWADSASLNLLKLLTTQTETGYLLLLGAYRDNEVNPVHPLMLTLDEIAKAGAILNTITLAPLSLEQVNLFVADTLSCKLELALPLAKLVCQKTKGNPFFATQFLKGLYEDEAIAFNFELGYWQCDMSRVRYKALTDNVVKFMALQLQKLPAVTVEVLKLAACIGNQFDLETLAVVRSTSPTEVAWALWRTLQEGLVLPVTETYKFFQDTEPYTREESEEVSVGYKFLHDRVQQAAYSLIPEAEKEKTHLEIGRLLLSNTPESNREARIFAIVSQLNLGFRLIETPLERQDLADLNLTAARKARASTAYEAARDNLKIALELLAADSWEYQYELTRDLYEEAALVAYLMGDFEQSDIYVETVLERGKIILDKIEVFQIKIKSLLARERLSEAIDLGLSVVDRLGIVLETEPPSLEQLEGLKNLPDISKPDILAALKIFYSINDSLFGSNPALLQQTTFTVLKLSVKYGKSIEGTISYLFYCLMLCRKGGDVEAGYRLGKMGLELFLGQFSHKAKEQISVVMHLFNGCMRHWQEPLKSSLASCVEAFQIGQENGELIFSGYQAIIYIGNLWFLEEPLDALAAKCQSYVEILKKNNLVFHVDFVQLYHQAALNLLGRSETSIELIGEAFDEAEKLPIWHEYCIGTVLFFIYAIKGKLAFLFGEIELTVNWTEEARKWEDNAMGFFLVAVNQFYFCLGLLSAYPNSPHERQEEIISQVELEQKQMQYWASHAPTNFQHKYDLVEAEKAKVLGQYWEAVELYDRAIAGAAENGFLSEEALGNELAAKFYLDKGKEKIACTYMSEAYYCYARWGAKAKIDDLEKRYPTLLAPILEQQKADSTTVIETIATITKTTLSKTTARVGEMLDLTTLMKASRTLSKDISLEGAIANLMQVAMENAGAETAALMLFQEQVLMLTALLTDQDAPQIDPIPVETSNAVPLSIVNKVKRSRHQIAFDNASNEATYAADAYIQQHQPQSILCLPLSDRGKLIGILYLENNRVAGAFTSDRVEVLNMLCSQAAISLENASLYQQSTNYAQKLKQSFEDLKAAQLQLVQSEKMSALGNLVAGVAHEINNPVGFIAGNLEPAKDYVQDLFGLLDLYQQKMPNSDPEIEAEIERIDLEFVREDLPQIISAMEEGTDRIRHISTSLRTFSRTDKEQKVPFQLEDGLESTLLILKHRLKASEHRPEIQVVKNYGDLPEVNCYSGQLNQVFMNLLANAIDALEEGNSGRSFQDIEANPNRISIQTYQDGDRAVVKIADNGTGMPEAVKQRIFEQGFTTKAVGKGTGLGMAIAHQIVVEKHEGTITCNSELGKGTEFIIEIPFTPEL